jgi:hypothetical protein
MRSIARAAQPRFAIFFHHDSRHALLPMWMPAINGMLAW